MNTRTIAASILSLGLLASAAAAASNSGSSYCGQNTYYDDSRLACVSDQTGQPVSEEAGLAVNQDNGTVDKSTIGDFINESTVDRGMRSDSRNQ